MVHSILHLVMAFLQDYVYLFPCPDHILQDTTSFSSCFRLSQLDFMLILYLFQLFVILALFRHEHLDLLLNIVQQ